MALKTSIITILLFATLTVSDGARIRLHKVQEQDRFVKQVQVVSQNDEEDTQKSVVEDKIDKALKHRLASAADGTAADSVGTPIMPLQSPTARFQEAVSQGAVPDEPPSIFSKTLDYVKTSSGLNRIMILKAACDSSAFSCEEIIQLADCCWTQFGPYIWRNAVMVFAEGRSNKGCISDPANAISIVGSFASNWPEHMGSIRLLMKVFVNNDDLKPAKGVGPPPVRLQTGLRTDADMEKLLVDVEFLQLFTAHGCGSQGPQGLYEPGSPSVKEFESWLKQSRSHGEQFSGPQLVTLVNAIPKNFGRAVSALLQYLEQSVTGVTCAEVQQIMKRLFPGDGSFLVGLDALKWNILDGENKVDILASIDLVYRSSPMEIMVLREAWEMEEMVLRDVGVGLPPKNNPVFGLVKGNPVILVVDESTSMDSKFNLGNGTSTLRKFCYSQLERVLEGLPNGTYFNVIQYSSSALKIFRKPVLVNKTNIDAAMEAMGTIWRSNYTPGQDPVAMVRNVREFALSFKHLNRSTNRNSTEALRLAYATADLPSQQTDEEPDTLHHHGAQVVTKSSPQMYFLTSGQADGGTGQVLDNIDAFDNGRNIPVNSIAFVIPADPVAKQFSQDLANKTGGFFRSIEQATVYTNETQQEQTDSKARA